MLEGQFKKPKGWLGKAVGRFMEFENDELIQWTQSFLQIEEDDTVMEIGFGPGSGLALIADNSPGTALIGIDPSESMVEMTLRKLQKISREQQILLIHGPAQVIKRFDVKLDKVYAINNITFWEAPVDTLTFLHSCMNKGGRIALTLCPHEEGATNDTTEVLGGQLTSLLKKAGFIQIETFIKPTAPNNTVCVAATR
ncbi:class I SAM-dependent methyltransferase [Halobacillus sp. A5]|uniref:class I SAM-dependent methyltransferase n=1 Tax=Halobacillus sp. A5 TaxID=2880263 RepID=UPI0020A64445|nr:methyltransferase [Halobacillus sp. A5]MCP3029267.1 methyltransferase domain-containing protein [Halobacillus sp. A5]